MIFYLKNLWQKKIFFMPLFYFFSLTSLAITQYTYTQKELFPFSRFEMYAKNISSENLTEYLLYANETPTKDSLIDLDDSRYFLKYRLSLVPFSNSSLYTEHIHQELKFYFSSKKKDYKNYTFKIKYWIRFTPNKYNKPDASILIPMRDVL